MPLPPGPPCAPVSSTRIYATHRLHVDAPDRIYWQDAHSGTTLLRGLTDGRVGEVIWDPLAGGTGRVHGALSVSEVPCRAEGCER